MDGTAVVLTNGLLDAIYAKTAHGLIRGTTRFEIVGLIDWRFVGRDAGEVLDGTRRDIPIFASLDDALRVLPVRPDFFILGIASAGGRLTAEIRGHLREALERGLSIVNGMHDLAGDDRDLVAAADAHDARIVDIRRPPPNDRLHFWSGEIGKVRAPRIAVLGTDCAVGKRTTAKLLVDACGRRGIHAELIYTGQTGWMLGSKHGIIFDSLPNDFVPGELEHAVVRCDAETRPDLIVLEGQSALRNPSGPAGAELLVSARASGTILQHAPGRACFHGYEELDSRIPPLEDEIRLVELYGSRVLAVTLHGEGLDRPARERHRDRLSAETGRPVILPLDDGVEVLVEIVRQFLDGSRTQAGQRGARD